MHYVPVYESFDEVDGELTKGYLLNEGISTAELSQGDISSRWTGSIHHKPWQILVPVDEAMQARKLLAGRPMAHHHNPRVAWARWISFILMIVFVTAITISLIDELRTYIF